MTFDATTRAGVDLLTCRTLQELGVANGFTMRAHGFGARANGPSDHAKLADALGLEATASMKQVHGCDVHSIPDAQTTPECDGVVTDQPGLGLIVHTADCVPVLLWAETVNAVSAVHAGWRGTLANVAAHAVEKIVDEKGALPDELHVAMGPAIRACCFEVGDEVVDAFVAAGRDRQSVSRPGPKQRRHVDLIEDNRRQLIAAGVRQDRIYDSGCCTVCENERFYSYRKEGKGVGRVMGVIATKS